MSAAAHIPVMQAHAVGALNLDADGVFVDATYGRGGHTRRAMAALGDNARVIVIDRDADAVAHAREQFQDDRRVDIVHARFSEFDRIINARRLRGRVTAILFDLGVSSAQLDRAERGFSFYRDGPLDMRMDAARGKSAAEWLREVDERTLARVLREFGEERFARRVAKRIVAYQSVGELSSTLQLAELVREAVPTREPGKHPATRTFQAIRIAVNNELDEIESALPQAVDALATRGRLVVISFHSLEDRLVKNFLRAQSRGDPHPPDLPLRADALKPALKLVGKARRATHDEIQDNPRARSAVLRAAERTLN